MNTARKNVTQPSDWWTAFEEQARAEGLNLSEWIGECCKANLPKSVAEQLSARPRVGAPRKPSDDT